MEDFSLSLDLVTYKAETATPLVQRTCILRSQNPMVVIFHTLRLVLTFEVVKSRLVDKYKVANEHAVFRCPKYGLLILSVLGMVSLAYKIAYTKSCGPQRISYLTLLTLTP